MLSLSWLAAGSTGERGSMMQAKTGGKGFTLMEVIIVMSVLAMFAAMAVPLAGRLEARGRVRETERRLELVREGMLGRRGALDYGGRRIIAGYAGDLGGLPPLRRSVWDAVYQRWGWPGETFASEQEARIYWASGMGQPRSLWVPLPPGEDLLLRWRGPYLHEPRDEFPGNADHLRWTRSEQLSGLTEARLRAAEAANMEIEMRQTSGRLADAWGRSLLFFYAAPGGGYQGDATVHTTVYIVSEGPDLHSSRPAYRLDMRENADNLVLVITPQEWRDEARAEETRRLLRAAAEALAGRWGPVDRLGRPVFGGFIADQGRWPELFVWQVAPTTGWRQVTGYWNTMENPPVWVPPVTTDMVYGAVYGQPRGLWTRVAAGNKNGTAVDLPLPPDPDVDRNKDVVPLGFGWRGPYMPRPERTGKEEVASDAWGVPLDFRLSHAGEADPPPEQTLTISSAGQDGTLGTADDLRETVQRHFDVRRPDPQEKVFTVEGTVVNETDQNRWFRVRLHASPAYRPVTVVQRVYGRTTVDGQVYGRTTEQGWIYGNIGSFSLPVRRSSAGPRLLELVEVSEAGDFISRHDWTTVFVGSGGTATPEREPLVLRAR